MKAILLPLLLMSASFGQPADNGPSFPVAVLRTYGVPNPQAELPKRVVASIDGRKWTASGGAASSAGPGARSEQQARARIQGLLERIQNGADFAALAKEHSDDKVSAAKGGEWNPIDRSGSYPKAAIFALSPGEVSQPVRLANGLYLFKLESVERLPFAKVEPRIQAGLVQSRFSEWFRGVKLRFTAQIEDPAYFEVTC